LQRAIEDDWDEEE